MDRVCGCLAFLQTVKLPAGIVPEAAVGQPGEDPQRATGIDALNAKCVTRVGVRVIGQQRLGQQWSDLVRLNGIRNIGSGRLLVTPQGNDSAARAEDPD